MNVPRQILCMQSSVPSDEWSSWVLRLTRQNQCREKLYAGRTDATVEEVVHPARQFRGHAARLEAIQVRTSPLGLFRIPTGSQKLGQQPIGGVVGIVRCG